MSDVTKSTFAHALGVLKSIDVVDASAPASTTRGPTARRKSSFASLLDDNRAPVVAEYCERSSDKRARFDGVATRTPSRGPLVLWAADDAKRKGADVVIPAASASALSTRNVQSVKYLHSMYARCEGCVLADDAEGEPVAAACAFASAATATSREGEEKSEFATLVLCSPNALAGWCETLVKFGTPEGAIARARGSGEALEAISRALAGEASFVAMTHDTFRKCLNDALKVPWLMVIYDEVHRLKNSSKSKQYEAAMALHRETFRIGLSDEILENCDELESWHVLNWANPWSLGDKKFFQEYFLTPIADGHKGVRKELARARLNQLAAHLKKAFFNSGREFSADDLFATNAPDIGGKDDTARTAMFALESLAKFEKISVEEMARKLLEMDKKKRDALRWRAIADSEYGSLTSALEEWKARNTM